ncbi:hypothetical protein [Phenylobacterium sp.]|uniref:hypothetical protein n=1 Tax=Phenylobacterium sp. TaxID=1871053 RepID=UPI0035B0ED59
MDIAVLKARLEELGADLAKWPPDEAEAALALMSASDEAKDLFAHASADDAALLGGEDARARAAAERVKAALRRGG